MLYQAASKAGKLYCRGPDVVQICTDSQPSGITKLTRKAAVAPRVLSKLCGVESTS